MTSLNYGKGVWQFRDNRHQLLRERSWMTSCNKGLKHFVTSRHKAWEYNRREEGSVSISSLMKGPQGENGYLLRQRVYLSDVINERPLKLFSRFLLFSISLWRHLLTPKNYFLVMSFFIRGLISVTSFIRGLCSSGKLHHLDPDPGTLWACRWHPWSHLASESVEQIQ